jgi:hypothetical protein
MIKDEQEPLYVAWSDEARRSLDQLQGVLHDADREKRRLPRDLLRSLQAYAVGVHGLERMRSAVVPLDPGPEHRLWRIADGSDLYDAETGLRPERAGLRDPDHNVL